MAVASARRKEGDTDHGRDCQQSTDLRAEIAEIVRGLDGASVFTFEDFEACHRARQQISKVFWHVFAPRPSQVPEPISCVIAFLNHVKTVSNPSRKDFLKAEVTPNFLGQEAEQKVADLFSVRRLINGVGMLKTPKTRKPTPAARWQDPWAKVLLYPLFRMSLPQRSPNSDTIHTSFIHKYPKFNPNNSQRQTQPWKLGAVKICMMCFCSACVQKVEDLDLRAGKNSYISKWMFGRVFSCFRIFDH